MVKCEVSRAIPIPVRPPISEVTLTLSLEEAAIIRTILANISGVGPARHVMSKVSEALYDSGINFVHSRYAEIVQGELKYNGSSTEYAKFIEAIQKF